LQYWNRNEMLPHLWLLPVALLLPLVPGCANRTPNAPAQGLLFQVEPARDAAPATAPIEALALYRDARRDLEAGEQASAVAKLRRVRQLDPSYLDAANVLAVVLAEAGDLTGALAQLQAVLMSRPDDAVATANLVLVAGRLAERRGKAVALAANNRAAVTPSPATTSAVPPSAIRSAETVAPATGPTVGEAKGVSEAKGAGAKKTSGGPTSGTSGGTGSTPTPARIEFRNSTTVNGLARRISKQCATGLFVERVRIANWGAARLQQSEIQYRSGHEVEANETARRLGLPSTALHVHLGLGEGIDLRILIGTDMARQNPRGGCSAPAEGPTSGSSPVNTPANPPVNAPSVRS
jgi:tetratricopeptide (TPR) repeat protein